MHRTSRWMLSAIQALCVVVVIVGSVRLAHAAGSCHAVIIVDRTRPGTKYFWSGCAGDCNPGSCHEHVWGSYYYLWELCTCTDGDGIGNSYADDPCEMMWHGGNGRWDNVNVTCSNESCGNPCPEPGTAQNPYGPPPPDLPDPEIGTVNCPCP